MRVLRLLLLPVSWLYGLVLFLRNRLYDWNILPSRKGDLPTIVVGNLSLGGTGKTPHVEYLLKLLRAGHKPALLSRGYRRKTRGFLLAKRGHSAFDIGDEPYQVFSKFRDISVAVCENRLEGIEKLRELGETELVVLDDAFQHRQLIGDFNILITDYHRPLYDDFILPAGTLRDHPSEKKRADLIIISKCPASISQVTMDEIIAKIRPTPGQQVMFTTLHYGAAIQFNGPTLNINELGGVCGFSGIASPTPFRTHLSLGYSLKKFKVFGDHHIFSPREVRELWLECDNFGPLPSALFTTEKDAVRIRALKGLEDIPIFYIPVEIRFVKDEELFRRSVVSSMEKAGRSMKKA